MIITFMLSVLYGLEVWSYLKKHYFADYLKVNEIIEQTCSKKLSEILVDGGVYYENGDIRFAPPVYVQRYMAVLKILEAHGILNKVVELGCSELSFFVYLKNLGGVKEAIFVDIDENVLEDNKRKIEPLLADHIRKREEPLDVLVLCGNAAEQDERLIGADAVIAIELIEHMLPHDLDALPHSVFGAIKPKIAVLTTPNQEFNIYFKNEGFRHPDHKFEWTRKQFEDWANNVVVRYPEYSVTFWGIGPGPIGSEDHGCCSQMAVFSRHSDYYEDGANMFKGKCYKILHTVSYPHEPKKETDEEEDVSYKTNRFINYVVSNYKFFNEDLNQYEIPMDEIMKVMGPDITSVELVRSVLINNKRRISLLDGDVEAVVISYDGDDDDDEELDEQISEEGLEVTSENINIAGCGDVADESDWGEGVPDFPNSSSSRIYNYPPSTPVPHHLPNAGSSDGTVYFECDYSDMTGGSVNTMERRSDDKFYSWHSNSVNSQYLFPVSPALASVQGVSGTSSQLNHCDLGCSSSEDNVSQQSVVNKVNCDRTLPLSGDLSSSQLQDYVSSSAYCDSEYDSHCTSDYSQKLSSVSSKISVSNGINEKNSSEKLKVTDICDTEGNYSPNNCEGLVRDSSKSSSVLLNTECSPDAFKTKTLFFNLESDSVSEKEMLTREKSVLHTFQEDSEGLVKITEQFRSEPISGTSELDQGLSEIDCQSLVRHNFAQSCLPTNSCEQGKKKKLKDSLLFSSPIPFLDKSKNVDCDVGNKDFEIRLLYDINLDSNKNVEEEEPVSGENDKFGNVSLSPSTSCRDIRQGLKDIVNVAEDMPSNSSPRKERVPSFLTGEGEDSSKVKTVLKQDHPVEPREFVNGKITGDCRVSSSIGKAQEILASSLLEVEKSEEHSFIVPNSHTFSLKPAKVPKQSETPVNMNESFHSESESVFSEMFNIQSNQNSPDPLASDKFCSSTPQQMNRCHSLQHIKEQADKKLNRFSLCSEKECSLPNDLSKDGHLKLPQLGNSFDEILGFSHEGFSKDDSSQSRAVDSGYPNTSDRDMDTDLTPEQVDEILSENESSLEEREEEREVERQEQVVIVGPGAPVQFVEHVENGDVANNNRDDEGNNWEQGELGEVHFEQIIEEAGGVEVEAAPPPPPESDSEDEHKFMSACESLEDTIVPATNSSLEALPSSGILFSHSTSTLSSDDNTWLLSVLFQDTPVQHMARGDASSSYPDDSQPDLPNDSEPSQPELPAEVIVPGDALGGGEPTQQ